MRRDPRREAETSDMVVQRWLSGGSDNEINRCWLVAQCGTRPDFEFARGSLRPQAWASPTRLLHSDLHVWPILLALMSCTSCRGSVTAMEIIHSHLAER